MLNVQSDGKILASGAFNTYNGQPVGGLIRINADGSLDTTFNYNLLALLPICRLSYKTTARFSFR
jgi:hypothetical protein